jgi:ABC-type cobalamin/Fe3+-siderophores transport system ATPase subunit
MILITKVKLTGFKTEHAVVEVELSGSNVSIIFGDNGCGKTTFLKVLHGLLSQEEGILIDTHVQEAEIHYKEIEYDSSTSRSPEVQIVTVKKSSFLTEDESLQYDWDEFNTSTLSESSSLSLGVERGVNDRNTKIDTRHIVEFFRHPFRRRFLNEKYSPTEVAESLSQFINNINKSNLRRRYANSSRLDLEKPHLEIQNIKIEQVEELLVEKYRVARVMATRRIQNALFETLAVAVQSQAQLPYNNDTPIDFEEELTEKADRIIEALDDGDDNRFKSTVIDVLSNLDKEGSFEKIYKNPILTKLFVNIMEELKIERLILSSVNLLIETFNNYLIDGKELVVNNQGAYIKYAIEEHTLNQLSSGERHMLTFLSLVLFEGGNRNILIIDEPEISLNIKWQRELIPLFNKLIPETQIIVASHSPSLCNNNMDYLCELHLDRSGLL